MRRSEGRVAEFEARFEALGVRIHAIGIKIEEEGTMIKNKRITEDTQDALIYRLVLLSGNINTSK